jgi:3-deoxy-7-phosphoheptulonate synthase
MRVYFEKPRTTLGWKGLINDPGLDGGFDVGRGLRVARSLLLNIVDVGLPVGCEFLDPIIPQYLSDSVSWGSIGARTTESQIHRQLASGLSMPVGIKNSTAGDVQVAVDAIRAASSGQVFIGITDDGRPAILTTAGNPDCHVVLRGSSSGPNFDAANVAQTLDLLSGAGLPRRLVVDASHGNSTKNHDRQLDVVRDLARRIGAGEQGIVGVMLESFLVAGRQELQLGLTSDLTYGQSVTDACIGWDDTDAALHRLAGAVADRRTNPDVTTLRAAL